MLRFLTNFLHNIYQMMIQMMTTKKHIIHDLLTIYIKTAAGNTLCIDIDPKCDVSHIKKIVAPKIGLIPEELKVIFAGKELSDDIVIEECDLGQQSILHVVKIKPRLEVQELCNNEISMITNTPSPQRANMKIPLCETLEDAMFSTCSESKSSLSSIESEEFSSGTDAATSESNLRDNLNDTKHNESEKLKIKKVHFYVYCPSCKGFKQGKLRVRCHFCKSGAFTVHSDPQNWTHVLEPKQVTGTCENVPEFCQYLLQNEEPTFAEFYFKCSEHISMGENDEAVPLDLIRPNLRHIPCLACLEIPDMVFSFPCLNDHVTCLDCFKNYCQSKLRERQFWQHPEYGYTLTCPSGCPDSFIREIHHFRLLDDQDYDRYHRFATEEYVLQAGGTLCPQPGCGMGILADPDCTRITCYHCKYVFCRNCLQGYHIGECDPLEIRENQTNSSENCDTELNCDTKKNSGEEASRTFIKIITKPCPSCKTPTERDGGCMHMVCTRAGCRFHWCWVCQTEWTRECMGDHWFG